MNRVVDTTVISNYASVGRLDILRDAAGPLYLPAEVYDELIVGRLAGYDHYDNIEDEIHPFTDGGWLRLTGMSDDELALALALPNTLHPGERACLSIARTRSWGLLTDDLTARRQAAAWGIPLSGTLGVLLLAIEDRRLTTDVGNTVLGQMITRARYRSPVVDLVELLTKGQ